MARLRFRTLAAVATAAVMLAACGGGDDAADEGTGATPEPTITSAPEPAPTETQEAEPAEQTEPKTRTYQVKEGDSLFGIAQKFNTTVRAIVRLNNIDDPNLIKIGRELKIPPPRS